MFTVTIVTKSGYALKEVCDTTQERDDLVAIISGQTQATVYTHVEGSNTYTIPLVNIDFWQVFSH